MAELRAFDPDPSIRWLFCMTHPDDELSIATWIRRCVQAGCEVWMSWTHATPARQREARAVAHMLGVRPDRIFFHGGTDGSVCDEMGELLPSFRSMIEKVDPDRVVCGAFEQGHLDHDATHWLVTHSFDGPVFEAPFYHIYTSRVQTINRFSDTKGQTTIRLTKAERRFKRALARQYPSQNIWSVLLWYEIVHQGARLRPFRLAFSERLRLAKVEDYRRPAHPPRIASRVRRSSKWRRWRRALRRAELFVAVPPTKK
ncbi:hypothetical protein EON82_15325 [bacterium]|nr:MAG: hypothetical protein EON82_15325 [bacterium]